MNRKPIFDAARQFLGRGFSQEEVAQLDSAIDAALTNGSHHGAGRTSSTNPCKIGDAGIALIKQFEGCAKRRSDGKVEAYPDPGTGGDPWTIGWGATGQGIAPGTVWSQEDCDARLASDLAIYAAGVSKAIGDAPTTQRQFDALVSFHYNTGAIGKATLTQKHVAGDYAEAAREFAKWKFAGGKVMQGLVRRREAEAKLYRAGS